MMATSQLKSEVGSVAGQFPVINNDPKIKSVEYFRVKPRWLFVKICDDQGGYGWGEGTLEGHTQAVEGTLDEMVHRLVGMKAE